MLQLEASRPAELIKEGVETGSSGWLPPVTPENKMPWRSDRFVIGNIPSYGWLLSWLRPL
jgi:hypothetical protein